MKPMRGVAPKNPLTDWYYYASPKIDGLRAVVNNGVVLSKTLKPIPNKQVQRMFGHLHGADGELTVGMASKNYPDDDVYDRSRGILMTGKDIPDADVQFHIFDRWDVGFTPTRERINCIPQKWRDMLGVNVVTHELIINQSDLDEAEQRALRMGYEGLMLRQYDAPYKYGQSTEKEGFLLKLKRFQDSEAMITCVIEQEQNTNAATVNELGYSKRSSAQSGKVGKGTLGAFMVRDLTTGVEFSVGNGKGLTSQLRQQLWEQKDELVGKIITYTFQEIGTKDAPRLPQFKGFRDLIDIA